MEKIDLTKEIHKASNIIASCTTCVHVKNAANYLENFKQQTNNEEYYGKLVEKLNIKREELSCDFRY